MKKLSLAILILIPLFLFSYTIEETLAQIESLKKELSHNEQIVEEIKTKLEIFNIRGQKVKSFNSSVMINGNRMSFDSSKMPSGIYLMKLVTENEVAVKKFLIMR